MWSWRHPACRADKTAENVEREVRENGVDLVLHVGDISYANGVVKIWDTFMRYIEPYASAVPYMIGIGNHEYDYKTGREKAHKHKHHTDASGSEEPYDPDWGNYGAHWLKQQGTSVEQSAVCPSPVQHVLQRVSWPLFLDTVFRLTQNADICPVAGIAML